MNITLEQIDELRSRVNVSYEEAKSALERNNGDLIKSIIELENKKGNKRNINKNAEFTGFLDKLLQLRFSVKNKNGNTLVNIPLVLALLMLSAPWILIFTIIIIVMTECKVRVFRDKNSINISGIKKNVHETVDKIKVKSEEIIKEENVKEEDIKEKNTEYEENEIIIE